MGTASAVLDPVGVVVVGAVFLAGLARSRR
jgi:hypothetical protein